MPDATPTTARYKATILRAGSFKLDGGSMFGLIPRAVWSRSVPTDDAGRITVAHNCILLDRTTPGDGPRRVLIEAGSGDKLEPKMREVFSFEVNPATGRPRTVADALAEVGVAPESIDAIVVSHLHFDHAGGLTRLPRAAETPEFPFAPSTDGGGGSAQSGGCCLTFPNATIYTQQREWTDALANRSVMTKTYYPDHLLPIQHKLKILDSPRPFPTGYAPGRDEVPLTPIDYRRTELWPGADIWVFLVPGHTWGQQAVMVAAADLGGIAGQTLVFTPDVMPTVHHVGAAYSLGYDVEPYTSMISRRWFLTEAAARGWLLCLDHEPGNPLVRVRENGRGWFELAAERG